MRCYVVKYMVKSKNLIKCDCVYITYLSFDKKSQGVPTLCCLCCGKSALNKYTFFLILFQSSNSQ